MMSVLSGVKGLWEAWNIRGCMLLSLFLQAFLILSAPFRKRCVKKPLNGLIWLAYLLWDFLDTSAIGLISRNIGDARKLKEGSDDFLALWASFLLLHLGDPYAITSFAIEDNQLWLRQLTVLIFQVLTSAYIFYLYSPRSKIWIPTAMVFLAGTIKYTERVRALYLASWDRLGPLERRKPYHGLDYRDAMEAHNSASSVDVLKHAGLMATEVEYAEDSKNTGEEEIDLDINLLQEASRFFDTLKGFIVGTIFSSIHREWSRRYFLNRNSTLAFRLIEYELSFMYDIFHTKVVVLRSLWCIARFVSFSLTLGASITFLFIVKQHEFHSKFDVKLSYALLMGAIGLEIINALLLLFSDGTVIAMKGSWRKFIPGFILRTKVSGSCSQYNMIRYCFNGPPTCLSRSAAFVGLGETLDHIYVWAFSSSRMVRKDLEEFIFEQLKEKSDKAKSLQDGKEACSQRGGNALHQTNCSKLKWSIEEYEYGQSLLLWHVATEICYQTHSAQGQNETNHDKICKQLSDYLFYLFVMQSTMMGVVSGGWERALEDTCAEAKRFFKQERLKGSHLQKACQEIIDVNTPIRPDTVKGSNCKSMLFDASILAKQFKKLGNDQWKVMSQVWMELMSYAAINCRSILHAQQPSRGGELLTFVWLLMNHLGLGTQFYEYECQTRTKMVDLE